MLTMPVKKIEPLKRSLFWRCYSSQNITRILLALSKWKILFFYLEIRMFQNCFNLFSLHCNPTFVTVHLITRLTQCGQTDMSNHLFRTSLLFLSPQNDRDLSWRTRPTFALQNVTNRMSPLSSVLCPLNQIESFTFYIIISNKRYQNCFHKILEKASHFWEQQFLKRRIWL